VKDARDCVALAERASAADAVWIEATLRRVCGEHFGRACLR